MLKYDDFIIMVNEGLIKTHKLINCKNIIEREAGSLNHGIDVNFDLYNNTFDLLYDTTLTKEELDYLFQIFNNLGYYLSYYNLYKKNMSYYFPWIDYNNYKTNIKNVNSLKLFFESKYDDILRYKPQKLYHVTNIKNIYKIKKNGLYPRYFEKGDFRPDRIYLSLSLNDAKKILDKNEFNDIIKKENNKYIIYEIDTDNINNLVLYLDPRSDGLYTYNHINPNIIKIIN
jgi:hypothetical protein